MKREAPAVAPTRASPGYAIAPWEGQESVTYYVAGHKPVSAMGAAL